MPSLYFLIGPTCVGKTALGVQWARANNAEILCADAPLVYKGMDIGTAKPTSQEKSLIPHYGIDLVEVNERFSIQDYATYAAKVVQEVLSRGKKMLVVGGSGFYLKSFFAPVTDGIEVDERIVKRVGAIFVQGGLSGLLKELKTVGGQDLVGLDIQNPRRVAKALERCLASGQSYQEIRQAYLSQAVPYAGYQKRVVMLVRSKAELQSRIRARVEAMLAGGLVDEVVTLRQQGIESNPQAASIIGYRETLKYLEGKLTRESLKATIVQDTLVLVRKQRTFFKQLPVDRVVELREGLWGDDGGLF